MNTAEAPKWLTKDYIENVLRNYKKDNKLKLIKWELRPAIPQGENYASLMTRAKITYESNALQEQEMTFIIKSSFQADPVIAAIYEPYQSFATEMALYEKVLPELSTLLHKIGDKDKLFADTIYVDYENEAILFEDLAVYDFCVADRLKGLDMEHTKLALKKLAKMHATAAVLNEKTKGSLEQFTHGIFNRHTRNFGFFFEAMFSVCAEFAGNCPELGLYYKEKLLKLREHVVEYATRTVDDKPKGHFYTLCHGDFWVNNIMIRYGEKKAISDLLLIDFQFSKWTSPCIDLHYFFNTSLENQMRFNNQDELVQYYYSILAETLLVLGYNGHVPSLHEFCVEMEFRRFYAVTSALVVQTFMINDKTEDADVAAFHFDDERARRFKSMLYQNKTVQENAKKLLPFFDKRGLLDVTD